MAGMERTDRRVKLAELEFLVAKETLETGVQMDTRERWGRRDRLDPQENREIQVALGVQEKLAFLVVLDLRVRLGDQETQGYQELKDYRGKTEVLDCQENLGGQETSGPRETLEGEELKETRERKDLKGHGALLESMGTKGLRGTWDSLDQEANLVPQEWMDHKEQLESLGSQEQEEKLDLMDQKVTLAEVGLAILDHEDQRGTMETQEVLDCVADEETVVQRVTLGPKVPLGNRGSQAQKASQEGGGS